MAARKAPAASKTASKPASKAAPKRPAKAPASGKGTAVPPSPVKPPAAKAHKPTGHPVAGTPSSPWQLQTAAGTSGFEAFRDPGATPPALVVRVGKTELRYHLRCVEDLHAMLRKHGDWLTLGGADEQKPAPDGSVEAWGRAPSNPVGGWYGLKKGLRGRFGVYVPPVLEALGLVELEHQPRNNRVRAR